MRTFGGPMAIVETLNSVGVSFFANPTAPPSQLSMGKNLVLAAVIIQLVIIIIFFVIAGIFHFRCAKAGLTRDNKALTTTLATLYASMALIFGRCIYRLVEKTTFKSVWIRDLEELKQLSPLLRHEVFFYIFEASLMLVNSVMWNIWHPGRFLPSSHRTHLAEDGTLVTTEREDARLGNRSLLMRTGNILTLGLLDLFRPKSKGLEGSGTD